MSKIKYYLMLNYKKLCYLYLMIMNNYYFINFEKD